MKEHKKVIYFIRHGQTVANVREQTQGPDDPLNEEGIKQSEIAAKRLKNFDFEKIITSDYPRAQFTAETINREVEKTLELSEYFRELRRPSEFWGQIVKENEQILDAYKEINNHFSEPDWHYSDEENFFDLKKRAKEALDYLINQTEERILVVTHGNFLRCLLGIMLHGDQYSPQDYLDIEATFEVHNTSISTVEYKHHWRKNVHTWMITGWNDSTHLD